MTRRRDKETSLHQAAANEKLKPISSSPKRRLLSVLSGDGGGGGEEEEQLELRSEVSTGLLVLLNSSEITPVFWDLACPEQQTSPLREAVVSFSAWMGTECPPAPALG